MSATGPQPWTMAWEVTVVHLQPTDGAAMTPAPDSLPAALGQVATAADGHGNTYAIWAASSENVQSLSMQELVAATRTDIYLSYRPAGGSWGPQVKINDDPAISHSSPTIAMDGAGNAYAIWTASNQPGYDADIYFAYRPADERAENGWSASVRVNDDPGRVAFVPPALAVDSQGNAYVSWIDSRTGHASVYYAYRSRDIAAAAGDARDGWSANTQISDDPLTSYFPPSIVADARGDVYLAWEQGRTCGGVDVYFAGRTAGGTWGDVTRITPNPMGLLLHWPSLLVDPQWRRLCRLARGTRGARRPACSAVRAELRPPGDRRIRLGRCRMDRPGRRPAQHPCFSHPNGRAGHPLHCVVGQHQAQWLPGVGTRRLLVMRC